MEGAGPDVANMFSGSLQAYANFGMAVAVTAVGVWGYYKRIRGAVATSLAVDPTAQSAGFGLMAAQIAEVLSRLRELMEFMSSAQTRATARLDQILSEAASARALATNVAETLARSEHRIELEHARQQGRDEARAELCSKHGEP